MASQETNTAARYFNIRRLCGHMSILIGVHMPLCTHITFNWCNCARDQPTVDAQSYLCRQRCTHRSVTHLCIMRGFPCGRPLGANRSPCYLRRVHVKTGMCVRYDVRNRLCSADGVCSHVQALLLTLVHVKQQHTSVVRTRTSAYRTYTRLGLGCSPTSPQCSISCNSKAAPHACTRLYPTS